MNFSITSILCVVNYFKKFKLNITSYKIIMCVCGGRGGQKH